MRPQLLANLAAAVELALLLILLALGAVPQEQQPPLLLLDVALPLREALGGRWVVLLLLLLAVCTAPRHGRRGQAAADLLLQVCRLAAVGGVC